MRRIPVALAFLVALPAVSALAIPHDLSPPPGIAPLPDDLRDGELVRVLAAHAGHHPVVPKLVLPRDQTLASLVMKLGARGGVPLRAADVAPFAALDARVQAPAFVMLAAVDQAWDLRDRAFARLTVGEQRELYALERARMDARSATITPREAELEAMVDKASLIAAAILLLDTIDDSVTPLVEQAVAAGAWPATATADPVGVLRIGGTGNDVETIDRIVQIDPRGDDVYRNNAGGNTLLADLDPTTLDSAIAISLDYAGNDSYNTSSTGVQGFGGFGIGVLRDHGGNDAYRCSQGCQGSDVLGIGILRDDAGNDAYTSLGFAAGSADVISIARDDAGNDTWTVNGWSGGASFRDSSTGLLWDRGGKDRYIPRDPYDDQNYGWSISGGRGWFVDEGPELDVYQSTGHTCNDCTWIAGSAGVVSGVNGRGNDNRGGLAALLAEDGALFRR